MKLWGGGAPENKLLSGKKIGFTLAEVLITLGIIGLVMALTLPQLLKRYREKVILHKLESAYSLLSNAYSAAIFEHGSPENWPNTNVNGLGVAEIFSKYLKLDNICLTTTSSCHLYNLTTVHKLLNGDDPKYIVGSAAKLKDMTVIFRLNSPKCRGWSMYGWDSVTKTSPYYHSCGTIYVDINANSEPNRYGIDLFTFIYTDTRIVPVGTPPTPYYNLRTACNPNITSWDGSINGSFCTAWILLKKNMDYLRKEVNW